MSVIHSLSCLPMRKPSVRIAVVTSVILMTGVLAVVFGSHNRSQNDTPIPFLEQQGSTDLRGQLTIIGQKNSVSVVRVTFSAGTSTETLTENRIYLVTVPDDQSIASVPLDQVIELASNSNQPVNYFGYQYTSADAATEKANRDNADFHTRFPGVFFASTKALQEDASHGNTLENFATRNNITFTGALLQKNSQYFVVVNETGNTSFSVYPPVCGDGIRAGAEECDDGKQCSDGTACDAVDSCVGRVPLGEENLCLPRNGDGCTATCQSEVAVTFGWTQDTHINPPRSCTDLCALESGRFVRGDCSEGGCPAGIIPAGGGAYYRTGDTWGSATCSFAVGVSEKYCCCSMTTVNSCGDGFVVGNEQCDDGNTAANDGCSATCTVESGWACTGTNPSTCSTTCGDGQVQPGEDCDDGNTTPADGCSATCQTESGWACTGTYPSTCTATCGDGVKAGTETCDDGKQCDDNNRTPCTGLGVEQCRGMGDGRCLSRDGDGCSAACQTESGWNCTGEPSACTKCGNGTIETGETCDDHNLNNNDGCGATCQTETGYTCTGAPSTCVLSGNILRMTSVQFTPLDVQSGDYTTSASLSVQVQNVSSLTATNTTITMPMPAAILSYPPVLTFRSAGEGTTCSLNNGQLSCNLGDLQAGDTKSLALLFDVNTLNDPYCLDHSNISAALSAESDTTDPVSVDNHVSASLLAGCPVDFGIVSAHFDPGAEKRGANPTLNIIVKNYGPAFDNKDIVFAALPADLTFVNPQSACRFEWGRLHCSTGPIAPGQTKTIWADFHIAGNFIQCSGEIPLNVDLSFFGGRPDPNPGNDSSQATVTAVCPTPGADLDIGIQSPQQRPDQEVVFPVRVHNYGSDAASSVVVSHTLSTGVTFQSAQGADCNVQGNLLQCSLAGELAGVTQYGVGGEKNFSVTLRYPASQNCGESEERRETFSVENATSDPNPRNDSYTVFFQTACPADFGIVSAQFDPVSVPSGTTPPSTTTLSVNVENSGSAADDAYLNISWSNGNYFTDVALPPFCDTDWDYLKGNYTKCWTGNLSPGESKRFSFTYRANSGLMCSANVPIAIDLSLDGQGNDQNWNNNTTRATVTWECPQQ